MPVAEVERKTGQKTDGPMTLTDRVRRWVNGIADPVADLLAKLGFMPNTLTLIGFLMNVTVAVILSQGEMRWGALAFFLASAFDGLDGTLARRLNRVSRFGAFLDSTVDRLSEAAVFLGLLVWYTGRAEGLGMDCKVGLLTRMERFIVLFVGLLLGQVTITLWIMAFLTNFTALQRMVYVWRRSEAEEAETASQSEETPDETE
jgi:CDP-diacylglycerol--glycerol-3-phosphate 3-phosphatidyltransferase